MDKMFVKTHNGQLFNLALAELIFVTIADDGMTSAVMALYKNRIGNDSAITLFKSKESQEADDYLNWLNRQIGIGNPI